MAGTPRPAAACPLTLGQPEGSLQMETQLGLGSPQHRAQPKVPTLPRCSQALRPPGQPCPLPGSPLPLHGSQAHSLLGIPLHSTRWVLGGGVCGTSEGPQRGVGLATCRVPHCEGRAADGNVWPSGLEVQKGRAQVLLSQLAHVSACCALHLLQACTAHVPLSQASLAAPLPHSTTRSGEGPCS